MGSVGTATPRPTGPVPHRTPTGGTRIRARKKRRLWIIIPVVTMVVLSATVVVGLLVIYPRVARNKIREKLGTRLAQKIGREIKLGKIDVSLGHASIRDIEVRGPMDGDIPLVHIDKIDVEFETMPSLIGRVELGEVAIDGVNVTVRRDAAGQDNVRDIMDRLRKPQEGEGSSGGKQALPASVRVTHVKALVDDAQTGATLTVADAEATWKIGEIVAEARGVTATTIAAPKASVQKLGIRKVTSKPPVITVDGGEIAASDSMSLSGIAGSVVPNPENDGRYTIDLTGGWGGVPGKLWTAKGGLDTKGYTASLDVEAAKFQLERLAAILDRTAVVDYKSTTIDTKVHVDVDRNGAKFAGKLNVAGLNFGHPYVAEKVMHDLSLAADVAGSFDRAAGRLELTKGDFVMRELPFSLTGTIVRPRHVVAAVEEQPPVNEAGKSVGKPSGVPTIGPAGVKELDLHLVIPPTDCQAVLRAIPTEMAPYLDGYKLHGKFDTDIHLGINWDDLDKTILDGSVGINKCVVDDEPKDGPRHRLRHQFTHHVEVEKGEWIQIVVGPDNENFVPFAEISDHLKNAIMNTEDYNFRYHHGFIVPEFRTALINNLKKQDFRQGASSITMQLVKNVLLYREKTLSRKFQELFLTWYIEQPGVLGSTREETKNRIMEIYFNVIEYGPGLYGIGPAAETYFGKVAKNLTPAESAFFSSILPDPRRRYRDQYCVGHIAKWTEDKITGYLHLMLQRKMITQQEHDDAIAELPLTFAKDGSETEEECVRRAQKIIKNTRSTAPGSGNVKKK